MLALNDGRSELWQWDTGRTLTVDADCSQVHFSNKVFGRSIDVDVADGVAVIPDILLQTDKDLNVWAFAGTAENGYTKISKTFKVNRRNKPADYVFTPTDQITLQEIQHQIGDLDDLTTEEKDTLVAAINEAAKSGGGVQPDWNQNDDSQPDYVKNRPFYTGSPVETVLVEETTVSFPGMDEGLYMGELKSTFSATVGETYKVSWDGTVYECTCVDFSGMAIIGNLSIAGAGSNTGEPFIMIVNNGQKIKIGTADTSASHTFSISGNQTPIVKIPAKYIDKDASGYIVIHKNNTMTEQEAENYADAISKRQVVFIVWGSLYISKISINTKTDSTGVSVVYLNVGSPNGELYKIAQNSNGLFGLIDRKLDYSNFPNNKVVGDPSAEISIAEGKIKIIPSRVDSGVGTTDALFYVEPNGIKSKSFEILGNGEAVAPALILYSSTANSTKKFKITVDDSGTLKATEVT